MGGIITLPLTANQKLSNKITAVKTNIASRTPFTPSSSTVVWLKFDNNVNDSSSKGNTGSATGMTYSTGCTNLSSYSGVFNGSSSMITLPNASQFSFTSSFTVMFWIKTSGTNTYYALIGKYDTGNGSTGWSYYMCNGGVRCTLNNIDYYGPTINDGNWHHVAIVVSATGIMHEIIDGSVKSNSVAWTPLTNTANVTIGYRDATVPYFVGSMDEIIIESRVWADTEVQAYYNMMKGLI